MTPGEPPASSWRDLGGWWLDEVEADPTYRHAVLPLVADLAPPGGVLLDLGCGEGQVMARLAGEGRTVIGVDLNRALLGRAARHGPVVEACLPRLDWVRDGSVDGCIAVLVVEHLEDLDGLFGEVFRVVRHGGTLLVVSNHPFVMAPGAASVIDPTDGEVFWRWGTYLEDGRTVEKAGDHRVEFVHRPLGRMLGMAASAGWVLETCIESGLDETFGLPDAGAPRLVGLGWRKPG